MVLSKKVCKSPFPVFAFYGFFFQTIYMIYTLELSVP